MLVGSPLGQLQFLNTDTYWFSSPSVIAVDSTGATYVVSKNSDPAGGITATKLDSSRRTVYSFSFSGVNGGVSAAAVDSQGSLIIGGSTSSTSFPRVNPLFYPRLPTSTLNERGFVAKVDPAGTTLMFSTLVGDFRSRMERMPAGVWQVLPRTCSSRGSTPMAACFSDPRCCST